MHPAASLLTSGHCESLPLRKPRFLPPPPLSLSLSSSLLSFLLLLSTLSPWEGVTLSLEK